MCKVDGCLITSRGSIKYKKCWRDFGMCYAHAVEFHPESYPKKSKDTRLFIQNFVGVRGKRFQPRKKILYIGDLPNV